MAHYGNDMLVREFFDAIFKRLISEYRDEYVYKNAIAEKILLGKHNLRTASMLTEFRVDDCKADVVVLNGTSEVYEIKSEMDNFERLDRQIAAYKKMFDLITIITTERLFMAVEERTPEEVGIRVLADGRYHFRKSPARDPVSNSSNVDPLVIFNSLQQGEYLKIIKELCKISLSSLPNTKIYSVAKKHFEMLSPEEAHEAMVKVLKSRRGASKLASFINEVPNSLKAASLSLSLTGDERLRFSRTLDQSVTTTFV